MRWVAALAVAASLAACGDAGEAGEADATLHVLAAASLTDAFGDLAAAFEAANPGIDVELNLAASSSLREQVLAGAPADVFASADPAHVDQLVEAGAVEGAPVVFATNGLQVVVPADNPGDVAGIDDLADADLLVGLCAPAVPCGALAREALELAGIEAAVDTEEPDVRSLLAKIADGELDAGIVYRTDVLAAGDAVRGIDLPDGAEVAATYPIVAVDDSDAATAFIDFVAGDAGRAVLAEHGFGPP